MGKVGVFVYRLNGSHKPAGCLKHFGGLSVLALQMLFELVEPDLHVKHFGSNASQEVDDLLLGFGHDGKEPLMACRCQERRDAIRAAAQSKSIKQAGSAARFVVRTAAEDLARAMNIRRNNPTGKR